MGVLFEYVPLWLELIFFWIIVLGIIYSFMELTNITENFEDTLRQCYFLDPDAPSHNQRVSFPSYCDPPTVDLSIIVPAYNEQDRLPAMLEETMQYLEDRCNRDSNFTYEVLIVDDGSKDNTFNVAMQYVYKYKVDKVRLLSLHKNRGKGGAIRHGMLCARGKKMLMADGDGATKIEDVQVLEDRLREIDNNGMGVVCGSRTKNKSTTQRLWYREFVSWGFHILVSTLCVKGIRDTQCGFKLFSRRAAHLSFLNLHVERWAFDAEALFIAQSRRVPVVEVPVRWQEIAGTKLKFSSVVKMGRDILLIFCAHTLGVWDIRDIADNYSA